MARPKKQKQVDIAPLPVDLEDEVAVVPKVAPGKASEILLNVAYEHYNKVFTGEGELAVLDKHTNEVLILPEDAKYYMEIIHGHEIVEEYY